MTLEFGRTPERTNAKIDAVLHMYCVNYLICACLVIDEIQDMIISDQMQK